MKVNRELLNKLTDGLAEIPETLRITGSYYAEDSVTENRRKIIGGACAMGHMVEIGSGKRDCGYELKLLNDLIKGDWDDRAAFKAWVFRQNDVFEHTLAHIAEDMESYFKATEDA